LVHQDLRRIASGEKIAALAVGDRVRELSYMPIAKRAEKRAEIPAILERFFKILSGGPKREPPRLPGQPGWQLV
jgi:hypothetical protein